MRTIRVLAALLGLAAVVATPASAVTPADRCDAFKLTGSGKRILAKLRCHARAKLQGVAVDADCLDRAEKRYVMHVAKGGVGCLDPDDLVALGADADEQMSALVEDVGRSSSTIPDLTGAWETRTIVSVDPNGYVSIDCNYYPPGQCPDAQLLAITDCQTQTLQTGGTFTQTSQCSTPPESPVQLGTFSQQASGTVNVVTGEWALSGTVQPPGFPVYVYASEGVYAADGRSMTGFSTAGFATGESLWLASTTGAKID
jgi:hypothetical protein